MQGFYVSAVNDGAPADEQRTLAAVGPFRSHDEAARHVRPVVELTEELDPVRAPFLTYGVARVVAAALPVAAGNERFGLVVVDGFVVTLETVLAVTVAS